MFDALETGFGLDVILWLQNLRIPALEILVKLLDYMGEELLYIALIALVYWLFNKGLGMRLIFILLIISLMTNFTKDTFATERPYEVSDAVNELVQEESYGLPSGHVAISLAVLGYLVYALRRRWLWAVLIVYVLLQGFGRMLAGAHYPQDVIGGILLGAIVLALYIPLAERVATFWKTASHQYKLGLVFGSLLILLGLIYLINVKATANPLLLTLPEPCPAGSKLVEGACSKSNHLEAYFTYIGLLLGAVIGAWFEAKWVQFKPHSALARRLVQYVVGVALSIGFLIVLGSVFHRITETGLPALVLRVMRYAFVAFFALGLWPWLSIRMGLMEKEIVTS